MNETKASQSVALCLPAALIVGLREGVALYGWLEKSCVRVRIVDCVARLLPMEWALVVGGSFQFCLEGIHLRLSFCRHDSAGTVLMAVTVRTSCVPYYILLLLLF